MLSGLKTSRPASPRAVHRRGRRRRAGRRAPRSEKWTRHALAPSGAPELAEQSVDSHFASRRTTHRRFVRPPGRPPRARSERTPHPSMNRSGAARSFVFRRRGRAGRALRARHTSDAKHRPVPGPRTAPVHARAAERIRVRSIAPAARAGRSGPHDPPGAADRARLAQVRRQIVRFVSRKCRSTVVLHGVGSFNRSRYGARIQTFPDSPLRST